MQTMIDLQESPVHPSAAPVPVRIGRAARPPRATYHTANLAGINLFYREAGDPARPTVVLLHGFPSSSHMYRELIPLLATQYHVLAPDYPGFGHSDQPSPAVFSYTFDHLAAVVEEWLATLKVDRYAIAVQDYGAPVGFRLFARQPERITAIITQNGNAYEEGLSSAWADLRAYWNEKSPANEAPVRRLLSAEVTKFQYIQGVRNVSRISPDAWAVDQQTLDRAGNDVVQLALFYDYQNNLRQYGAWQATLRRVQPPLLAVWGRNDPFFLPAGAEAFRRDVPAAEIHFFDTGHFALEEEVDAIAERILDFLERNQVRDRLNP